MREDVTKHSKPTFVPEKIKMAKYGEEKIQNYDHTSGNGYVKAKQGEQISMSKGIIARWGQNVSIL